MNVNKLPESKISVHSNVTNEGKRYQMVIDSDLVIDKGVIIMALITDAKIRLGNLLWVELDGST